MTELESSFPKKKNMEKGCLCCCQTLMLVMFLQDNVIGRSFLFLASKFYFDLPILSAANSVVLSHKTGYFSRRRKHRSSKNHRSYKKHTFTQVTKKYMYYKRNFKVQNKQTIHYKSQKQNNHIYKEHHETTCNHTNIPQPLHAPPPPTYF